MKKLALSTLITCICTSCLFGQQNLQTSIIDENEPNWVKLLYTEPKDVGAIIDAFDAYYEDNVLVKNEHTQYYKRWLHSLDNGSYYEKTVAQIEHENRYLQNRKSDQYRGAGTWTSLGPFDYDEDAANMSYAAGSGHVYTVEQSISNTNVLYAGTATAGLWKSTDKGLSWTLKTRDMLINQVYAIEIDPTDEDVVYMSGDKKLWKSTDGGNNWSQIGDATFKSVNQSIRDIAIPPNNNAIVYVCSDQGLYRSTDGGSNFTQIQGGDHQEIEFQPTNNSIVYVTKLNGSKTEFYKSTNSGVSFSIKTSGWPNPPGGSENKRVEISVTPANTNKIVALATGKVNGGDGLYGIYISTDAGETWSFECCGAQEGGAASASNISITGWSDLGTDDGGQYYYDLATGISHNDEDKMFFGAVNLWHSDDGGSTLYCPSKWSHSSKDQYVHADIHDIKIYGSDIWIANDGGIFYSNDEGATFNKRMKGIEANDLWGFGIGFGEIGHRVMTGGAYHNGTMLKDNSVYTDGWVCVNGGDGEGGDVNPANDREVFTNQGAKIISGNRTIGWTNSSFSEKPNWHYTVGKTSNVHYHPSIYTTVFIGKDATLRKSTDNGVTFSTVYTFPANVADFEICPTNPDVIYVTTWPGHWDAKKLYRSTNGGTSFTDITPSGGFNTQTGTPFDITLSYDDDQTIWIAQLDFSYSESSVNKVLKSTDQGASWTAIGSSTLDGHKPRSIVHQANTNGGVYLGTNYSVFYRDNSMSDWVLYASDLPASTATRRLVCDYYGGTIVNASNRSVYEAPLYADVSPIAIVSSNKLTTACGSDLIIYIDQSTASGNGFVRTWTFEGGIPATSSDASVSVSYPLPGTYDVTLEITDANGTDIKTLVDYITVTGSCTLSTDVGISSLDNVPSGVSCTNTEMNPSVTIVNGGTQTITVYTLKIYENDVLTDTRIINTSLAMGATEVVSLGSILTTSKLRVEVSNPNNTTDSNSNNDSEEVFISMGSEIDYNDMSSSTWSSHDGSDTPVNAFDNDQNTIWHSRWSTGKDPMPYTIEIDLTQSYYISAVKLLNRQNNSNGFLKNVSFEVSDNGSTWTSAGSVDFASTTAWQTIGLPLSLGRYVRVSINTTQSGGDVASIAELRFIGCLENDIVTDVENDLAGDLTVFPNPFDNEITINNQQGNTYVIYNMLGEKVESGILSNNRLDLNDLVSGGYLLNIIDEKGAVSIKTIYKK